MTSLRTRILVGTIAGTLAVLSLSAGGLYATVRRLLQDDFNASLLAKAGAIAGMVEQDGDKIELEINTHTMPEFGPGSHCEYFELRQADGTVVYRSPSLAGGTMAHDAGNEGAPAYRGIQLPDGRPGRLVRLNFRPRQGSEDERPDKGAAESTRPLTLMLARETRLLDRTLMRLAVTLVSVASGAMLLSGVVLSLVVRRGMRPLDQLARQISGMGEDLTARASLPNAPAELGPLIERLNDLLSRLQAAFERERRFSADVAHELRTPLAGLRSTLEVCTSKRRNAEAYEPVLQDCLVIARQMQGMVDNLLALVHLERGRCRFHCEPVNLDAYVRACWAPLAARAEERGLQLEWQLEPACAVESDPELLRQVMHSVFENAVTYTNQGGRVRIEANGQDHAVRIRTANTGCALTPADAEHVFERFWRGDSARSETGLHCGLGLSLARETVALLGGSIIAEATPGQEFAITITLPRNHA